MNETELALYRLKQRQTNELSFRFKPDVARLVEGTRDLAMIAWGEVGGGRKGQDLLDVLLRQISEATNVIELGRLKGGKK